MFKGTRIRARIDFLPAENGGRTTPLIGGTHYRPNHNPLGPDDREMMMGEISVPIGSVVQPGDSLDIDMTLYPGRFASEIVPGRQWRVQEGAKLVAMGTVLALLPMMSA